MDKPSLTPEFQAFLSLLNENRVRFLVVGGYAVGFHGHVRYTKDIDLWIDSSENNAERLRDCIQTFFGNSPSIEQLMNPRLLLRIGAVPTQIELMTQIDGVSFDACFNRKKELALGELTIPYLSLHDLRQNKRASGRPQDLADLDNLPTEE